MKGCVKEKLNLLKKKVQVCGILWYTVYFELEISGPNERNVMF